MKPIISRADVARAAELKSRRNTERGAAQVVVGKPRPLITHAITLYVMRVTERENVKWRRARQAQHAYTIGRMYARAYYSASRVYYVVAAIDWRTCQVVELQSFSTKAAAIEALRR